jgi:hypothetical protein
VVLNLPHGHIWTFGEVDAFVDSVLRGGTPLPRLQTMTIRGDRAVVAVKSRTVLKRAELHYTTDTGEWQKRQWKTVPAELRDNTITAQLPQPRPLVCYLSVTDEHGLRVSSEHAELLLGPR